MKHTDFIKMVDLSSEYQMDSARIDGIISGVLAKGDYLRGGVIKEFEEAICNYCGVQNCIAVASGYDALYISLKCMGIGVGDEVITTAYSWVATANAITQTGASPVFVDIESNGYNIDVDSIESKITSRTKAILPVHLYGIPCEMKKVLAIARKYDLMVLEDAAQAFGSFQDHNSVGTYGNAGVFSFYPTKALGAFGDGGCIITNDDELASKLRSYSDHGQLEGEIIGQGVNSRMDSIQAAILKFKLSKFEKVKKIRQEIAKSYLDHLQQLDWVVLPNFNLASETPYNFPILVNDRDELKEHLLKSGVETGHNYSFIIPETPAYQDTAKGAFHSAQSASERIMTLPLHPMMDQESVDKVLEELTRFVA